MPTTNGKIGFEHKGIGEVLAQNRLAVPLNQREYSWEEEHVGDLFSDFANAIANNAATYFLGTIVLTKGEGDLPEVSDGQQRLATTTILLAAIRDYFARHDDSKRVQSLQPFLMEIDRKTTDLVPKLRLNIDDNEFFTKFVLPDPGSADRHIQPSKESHRRIRRAAELAEQHIRDILGPYAESVRTNRLLEWVDFIEKGAQVILLRVPDHLNAFVMFETLNDRGLKASQADLIKNYLFSQAGPRKVEAQSKWSSMVGVLESLGQGEITVTYLHHVLITKYGPTKEREVLDKARSYANSPGRALEFLDELAESASDYAALFNPDHAKWNQYGSSTRHHISTIIRDLRVEQIRPLMFAVARHFSVKEAQKAFRLFVFWSVRFLVVGGRGGLLDRNYGVKAQEIGNRKIKTADELAAALGDIIPADRLFEASFAEARVSQVHLARYYLRALEQVRKYQPDPEFIPNDDEQVINLEHILPESPQSSWPHMDAETANAYWRRIGNMVILQAKKNSIVGNSSFDEKKKVLKESAFLLTSEVAEYTHWSPKEITERQQKLAALAVKTWPSGLPSPGKKRRRPRSSADPNEIAHRIVEKATRDR